MRKRKRNPNRKFSISEWLDIDATRVSKAKWRDGKVALTKACPECGERRQLKIVSLRNGFKFCETCKTEYVVTELLNFDDLEASNDD